MSDFGKLEARFWQRGTGKRLRGDKDAQILAMYLMSCESARALGLFYLPWALLTSETGLTVSEATSALVRLEAEGFAFYDRDEELAWLPGMALRRVGDEVKEGDKRRPGLLKDFASLPDHHFRDALLEEHGGRFGLCAIQKRPAGKPLGRGFEGASKGLPASQEGASKGDTPLAGIEEEEIEKKKEKKPLPPPPPPLRESEQAVLDALAKWPALSSVATVDMVHQIRGTAGPAGWGPDDVLSGIDDLGEQQGLAKVPMDPAALSKLLAKYIKTAHLRRRADGNAPPRTQGHGGSQGSRSPGPSSPYSDPSPEELAAVGGRA